MRGTQPDFLVDMDAGGDELVIGGYYTSFLLVNQQGGDLRFGRGAEDAYLIKYAPTGTPLEARLVLTDLRLFPNPTTETASLSFSLEQPEVLDLSLYDAQGRRVQLLQRGYLFPAGSHQLDLKLNPQLPGGLYFLQVDSEQGSTAKRLLIQK